ncbi:S-layer homology domain-containing protein [Evtepia sp.]
MSIDATTNLENFVDRGESVITFRENPEEGEHPFIALQAVSYANYSALTNVLDSTGKVGPSDSLPVANLSTAVLWWGEEAGDVSAKSASLRLITENGIPVADAEAEFSVSNVAYPFSNLVTTQYNVTLDKNTMEGVLGKGESTGLQLEYYPNGESLSRRETLSFTLVNLLGVGKVEEAKSLPEMMKTMGSASGTDAGAATNMSTADQYVNTALNLVAGDGFSAGDLFTIQITPTSDPTKFLGFIQVNVGDLHVDDSEGKGQVYANFNPGEDVQKSYAPGLAEMMFLTGQKTANQYMEGYQKDFNDAAAGKGSRDLEFALGGYAESLIYYNENTGSWEVQILNGGFNAGGGMSYSWNFNTWCGPVPFTATLTVGGSADISMDALSVAYYDTVNHINGLGTDFLTQLRIYLYVRFFAGVGFDYSVVAFKLGVYGEVGLDMRFRWLNRPYMNGNSNIINTADGVHSGNLNGQNFQVNGEIGLEFLVNVLFISYDKILFSYRFNLLNEVTGEWQTIDTYWANNQEANQAVIEDLVRNGSLSAYSSPTGTSYSLNLAPTLQSRDYLDEGGRRWGNGISLFSLDSNNGLANLESNTYPYTDPLLTDDGKLVVYVTDQDSTDATKTRVAFATKSGDSYTKGGTIPSPTDDTENDGYGDSQAALAGTESFAVAAWTRQMQTVQKDANEHGDIVLTDDDQRIMLNSADVFASVYNGSNWTTVNLSTDNAGSPDLAPVVATNGEKAIVAWRQVIVGNDTAGEAGAQYANVTDFSQKDTIVYRVYDGSNWSDKQVLYNGTSGQVKGLQAAMLADGTAAVTYTLDTDEDSQTTNDREIAYTVVDNTGKVVRSVQATSNNDLDENPQITTAKIGDGEDAERFILGWYTETATTTTNTQAVDDGLSGQETESDIRLLEFDKNGVAGKRLPDSLSQAADEDVRVTSNFQFAKNVESIQDLSILWVERTESQETADEDEFKEVPEGQTQTGQEIETNGFSGDITEWDVLQGVRLYENEGAYRFTASMALADMSEKPASVGTLIDSFDAYVSDSESNELKAVILGTTYGKDGKTTTEIAQTVNGETVQYTVPSKTTTMYTATGSYTDSIEVLGVLVDYDTVQLRATVPIQFTVKNNGIHAVDTLTVKLEGQNDKVFGSANEPLNLLPGQSTTLTVDYTVPVNGVKDVPYELKANFGASGATGQAETGATRGLLGTSLLAKTGGETAEGTVYLDLTDLSVTKAAIVKEEGGKRTIQIQLNNHAAADLEDGKHEVQLRFYTDATCETRLDGKYLSEAKVGELDGNTLTISKADDLALINNGGFATQVTFDAGKFVQEKSKDQQPQELPAGGVNVFIQAVVLGDPAEEDETASKSGDKVVQGEPRTTDNNATVTAENLAVRAGKDVTLSAETTAGTSGGTDVKVTVTNNLLTKEIQGNVTAVLLGKDGTILGSQQLTSGTGNDWITLKGETTETRTLTFADIQASDVASVKLVFSEAVTPEEGTLANAELSTVDLEGAVLTEASENSFTFRWGQDGTGLLVLTAKDPKATISCNGETDTGSLPLTLTVGQTGTLTVMVTNGEETNTYTIKLVKEGASDPGGGGPVVRPTYSATVSETQHGDVSVTPTRSHQGDKVTITTTPEEGYVVGEVTVTTANGKEVAVTDLGNGKYTFTQPGSSVTIAVTFVPETWPFTDVAESDWFYDAVRYAYENGLMDGVGEGRFAPNNPTTRAQLVTILYRLEGEPDVTGESGFTDVEADTWYTDAVAWAAANGIVNGVSETKFAPGNNITREQLATILFRYAESKGYDVSARADLSGFPDAGDILPYAQEAVAWAVAEGIIQGFEDDTIRPGGNATRAQIATILMRFCQTVVE